MAPAAVVVVPVAVVVVAVVVADVVVARMGVAMVVNVATATVGVIVNNATKEWIVKSPTKRCHWKGIGCRVYSNI